MEGEENMQVDPTLQALDPRIAEYQHQLPQFVAKLHQVFTEIMEVLRDAKLPNENSCVNPSCTSILHHLIALTEGELIPLSDLITKFRQVLPPDLADSLPISNTACADLILPYCERKAYGCLQDNPKDALTRMEAAAYPSLLVWEVELTSMKDALDHVMNATQSQEGLNQAENGEQPLSSTSSEPVYQILRSLDESRRKRKELRNKLHALEKLVRAIQSSEPAEKIFQAREKWREWEKKDEAQLKKEAERKLRDSIASKKDEDRKKKEEERMLEIQKKEDEKRKREEERQAEIVRRNLEQQRRQEDKQAEAQRKQEEKQQEFLKKQMEKEEIARRKFEEDSMRKADGLAKKARVKSVSRIVAPIQAEPPVKNTLLHFFKKVEGPPTSVLSSGAQHAVASPTVYPVLVAPIPNLPSDRNTWLQRWKALQSEITARLKTRARSLESRSGRFGSGLALLPGWAATDPDDVQMTNSASLVRCTTRKVFISIHDRARPPVRLLASVKLQTRRVSAIESFAYDRDTDEEWEEQHNGEDLDAEEDEEEEEEAEDDSEDSFVVADGVWGEGDQLSDDELEGNKKEDRNIQKPLNGIQSSSKWSNLFTLGKLDVFINTPSLYFAPAVLPASFTPAKTKTQKSKTVGNLSSDLIAQVPPNLESTVLLHAPASAPLSPAPASQSSSILSPVRPNSRFSSPHAPLVVTPATAKPKRASKKRVSANQPSVAFAKGA